MQEMAEWQGPQRKTAFTLIELLVVVAIIALLISILLPSLKAAREQAKGAVCSSNLHQLAYSNTYYAEENEDRLPFIRGTPNSGNPDCQGAPYLQYDQIFNFWKYNKDISIFKCPSAFGKTSARETNLAESNENLPGVGYYVVLRDDERFLFAYSQQWWPTIDPIADADADGRIRDLYTEYWTNDFGSLNIRTGAACTSYLVDGRLVPIPVINGGRLGAIPLPQFTVVMADAVYRMPRHRQANNLAFLDGHVERRSLKQYLDCNPTLSRPANDYDGFGNRPFWAWGLTRTGNDFGSFPCP